MCKQGLKMIHQIQVQLNGKNHSLHAQDLSCKKEEWDQCVLPLLQKHGVTETLTNKQYGIYTYQIKLDNYEQAIILREEVNNAYSLLMGNQ